MLKWILEFAKRVLFSFQEKNPVVAMYLNWIVLNRSRWECLLRLLFSETENVNTGPTDFF